MEEKNKRITDDSNPFLALIGRYETPSQSKPKKDAEKPRDIIVAKDSWLKIIFSGRLQQKMQSQSI